MDVRNVLVHHKPDTWWESDKPDDFQRVTGKEGMMTGFILTRESTASSKRYDACWRVNGKQKSKTFTRRKQAERYLTDVVKKVQDGAYVEIKPTTFKAFAERWLEGLADLKPSTRRAYTSMLTYQLVPAFGGRPLTALSVEDVNTWLRSREGTLRIKTPHNNLGLLHKILEDAREGGYLAVNRLSRSRARAASAAPTREKAWDLPGCVG